MRPIIRKAWDTAVVLSCIALLAVLMLGAMGFLGGIALP